jgi:hypothetical protein
MDSYQTLQKLREHSAIKQPQVELNKPICNVYTFLALKYVITIVILIYCVKGSLPCRHLVKPVNYNITFLLGVEC